MLSRWARLFVTVAAAFAVWAVATPAWAAAPMCDPRGATGIAPAPQLQQPQTSIDVASPDEECADVAAVTTTLDSGRAPEPTPPQAAQDPVVANVTPATLPAPLVGSFARDGVTGSERAGARSRVDRPPRG
jgi:hypothetical protein